MNPRNTLPPTRAAGQLQHNFFRRYVVARMLNGIDEEVGDAFAIFEGEVLSRLQSRLSEDALRTPVFFTDNLSNRVLATFLRCSM